MPGRFQDAVAVMRRALELAEQGIGRVEPNPPVGAVLVDDHFQFIAEGFHQQFGGPHAEVEALHCAGERSAGATLFVTLEPCCHEGKTGPCTEAIVRAGIRKVVAAIEDPYPGVHGQGIARLQSQGIAVEVGLLANEARRLAAPFLKRVTLGQPWVHAKWALTLDGKIATATGDSRWISSEASRAIVHALRGRMDAILIGAHTAALDNPLLTARPAGPKIATRIVVDSACELSIDSQLVRTVNEAPLLIAASQNAPDSHVRRLRDLGIEVLQLPAKGSEERVDLEALLRNLGRREFTNLLVEGGSRLFGSLFDAHLVDEVHVFVAPKIVGGADAPSAVGGQGVSSMGLATALDCVAVRELDGDVYVNGRLSPSR
jgi:diaminohydroxyphosphoribosylaminopyrimidine deaminase/5-amino-6-(5-phosphoribosylamino)uracil reductase